MINKKDNPVEWALLIYQLEDAEEHLHNLIKEMNSNERIDEVSFKINMGHLYGHINRAYNGRNHTGEIDENLFNKNSEFPKDLKP